MKKFNYFILTLILVFFSFQIHDLTGQATFQVTHGNSINQDAKFIMEDDSGGYAVTGWTNYISNFGDVNMFLLRIDTCGDFISNYDIGGINYDDSYVLDKSDSGYVLFGSTQTYHLNNTSETYLIETNSAGTALNKKIAIGGTRNDYGKFMRYTVSDKFIMTGHTYSYGNGNSDIYVVEMNKSGVIQWSTTIGGSNFDGGESIVAVGDNAYALTGGTKSYGAGGYDVYFAKINSYGHVSKHKIIGTDEHDYGYDIKYTMDGGFVITGYTVIDTGGTPHKNVYVIKLDSTCSKQWSYTYGGSQDDVGYSVVEDSDSNIVVAGYSRSFGLGGKDALFLKLSQNGTLLNGYVYGADYHDEAHCIQATKDGGYILSGYTNSFGQGGKDVYIIKTNSIGSSGCNETDWNSYSEIDDSISTGLDTLTGDSIKIGGTIDDRDWLDSILCRSCTDSLRGNQQQHHKRAFESESASINMYPNPTDGKIRIEFPNPKGKNVSISIIDPLGRMVFNEKTNGLHLDADLSHFGYGVYNVMIKTNILYQKKLILLK